MKKQQKILKPVLLLLIAFSAIVFTQVKTIALVSSPPTAQTKTVTAPAIIPQSKDNIQNTENFEHKPKGNFKNALLKFFTAMFGVLISALSIFAGLKLYKKFALKNTQSPSGSTNNQSLQSPKDFKEAMNLFLDKTNK